jgi:integrase
MNTNLVARNAKPNTRTGFGEVCAGLYLLTNSQGIKTWKCNYTYRGRYSVADLGRYPDVTPNAAIAKRLAIKDQVKAGLDPRDAARQTRAANEATSDNTVEVMADRWLKRQPSVRNWSDGYAILVAARLRNHVYPQIGKRPIAGITTQDIETLIDGIMGKGLRAQAVHVKQHLQLLFDYAKRHNFVADNVVRQIAEELPVRKSGDEREIKRARVGTIEEARLVLAAMESSPASGFLKLAHRLIALTATRKMEAADAAWSEIKQGQDGWTWTIPAARMKGPIGKKQEHVIPLSPQALEVFQAARRLADVLGIDSPLVFPGRGRLSLERSTFNHVMIDALPSVGLAGKHTVHGWRGTFSTLQNTEDPAHKMIIEVMLAHKTESNVSGRYNDSVYLKPRLEIACAWADKLLLGAPTALQIAGIEPAGNVVPFIRKVA